MTGFPIDRTEIDLIALRNRMRERRAEKNISVETLARRSGVELDVLQRLERGDITVPISMGNVLQLARALETTPDHLLSGRIVTEGSVVLFACSRRTKKRCSCGRIASKLCDFRLKGTRAGQTCDADICDGCAVSQGPNIDFCQPHARLAAKEKASP